MNGYRRLKKEFGYYCGELEDIREHKLGLTRILSDLPRSTSVKRMDDKWIELIDETDEIVDYLARLARDLSRRLTEIDCAISELPDTERMILVARHIKGMSFHDIQKDLQCSESKMYMDYRQALELIHLPELSQE